MPDYRVIPSIERLRQHEDVQQLERQFGHALVVDALRAETEALRARLAAGDAAAPADSADATSAIVRAASSRVAALSGASLRRVINATGVIVHTNLGRA